MPHIAPLDRKDLPQFEEKFARYDAIRGFLPNSILTMARRPNIAKAFMELNQAVLYEGTVPEDLKMMVALMTSMATGCRYCQGHMANLSHVYDVPDEKIAAVWECETSPLFTEAEKAALVLAREAAGVPNDVTDPTALPRAAKAAEININAARSYNRGLRAVYFAIAALAWLLGPIALIVATVITFVVLWRREFRSNSRSVLIARDLP